MAATHTSRLGLFRSCTIATLLVLGLLAGGKPLRADDAAADDSPGEEIREVTRTSAGEVRIARALYAETALKAPDHTLSQAVQMLADRHGINIVLSPGVAQANLPKTRVSVTLEGIQLQSALGILLHDVDGQALDYVIDREMILVDLRSEIAKRHSLRVYNVKPLLGQGVTAEDVARVVTELALPEGSRKASALGSHVIVSHNKYVHEKTLETLNRLVQDSAAEPPKAE